MLKCLKKKPYDLSCKIFTVILKCLLSEKNNVLTTQNIIRLYLLAWFIFLKFNLVIFENAHYCFDCFNDLPLHTTAPLPNT